MTTLTRALIAAVTVLALGLALGLPGAGPAAAQTSAKDVGQKAGETGEALRDYTIEKKEEAGAGVPGRSYVFGFAAWTLPAIVTCAQGLFAMIAGDPLAPLDLEAKLRRQTTL